MSIEKFTISRDDSVYECFPHLCRTQSGRILLVYRESNGHVASEFCRLIVRYSDDAGQSWSERRVICDEDRSSGVLRTWNGPKIQQLQDGRILLLCDTVNYPPGEWGSEDRCRIWLRFSDDEGLTWSQPQPTPVAGICPDQVTELADGSWLLPSNVCSAKTNRIIQNITISHDQGSTWQAPITLFDHPDYQLDEVSIVRMPTGELVAYQREDLGRPVQKLISRDEGATWDGPYDTLNPASIGMPIAGVTQDGFVMVTGRYGVPGNWRPIESAELWQTRLAKRGIVIPKVPETEAFVTTLERGPHTAETADELIIGQGGASVHTFAFLEPVDSALATQKSEQKGAVLPLDLDASPFADSGYTGWVEYERGRFLVVNYINDDAPMAQIRGYRFGLEDF
jgi:hypothetical protein